MENPWNLRDDTGTEEIPIEISPEYTEVMIVHLGKPSIKKKTEFCE